VLPWFDTGSMDTHSMAWADELRNNALHLAHGIVEELALGWPRAVVAGDLRYLLEGVASAVEFSCTGIVDRHFAWQKVRTVALGGSPQALEELPEHLLTASASLLSPQACAAMRSVLSNVAVYVRHAANVPPTELSPDSPAAEFLAAARRGDRLRTQGLVARADNAVDFAEEVLESVQREVGRLWQIGELTPPEEHLISGIVHETVYELARRHTPLSATAPTVAMVRCAGDEHSLGQTFLEFYLHAEGLRGRTLVVTDPVHNALPRFLQLDPAALAISCTTPAGLRTATRFVTALRSNPGLANVTLLLGGGMLAGVPQLATQLGADGGGSRGRPTASWLASRVLSSAI